MKTVWTLFVGVALSFAVLSLFSEPSFAQSTVCSPQQFETDIAVSTSPENNILKWSPNARWSYDYANRREFATITEPQGGKRSVILDFASGLQYVWTTSAQGVVTGCQAKYLSASMGQFCGTPDGSSGITVGGTIQAVRWTANPPGWQLMGGILGLKFTSDVAVEGLSTTSAGLPISMAAIKPDQSNKELLKAPEHFFQALFMNVTLGIRNPNVFTPPQSCQ